MTPATSPLPDGRQDCDLAVLDADTSILDALPRVSFRQRRQAIPADRPQAGRYLELDDGDEAVLLPLREGTTHVGRGFSADLKLDDQSVSRRHAILHAHPDGTRILDD